MKLGRIPVFDEKSRKYSISRLVPDQTLKDKYWVRVNPILNQREASACVGFSWCHWLGNDPEPLASVTDEDGFQTYRLAQTLDDIPGVNYDGTSVIAGAKAMLQKFPDVFSGYHWAFGLQELLLALSCVGPVVLGINWYAGMFTPDQGRLHMTGAVVGGHAILAVGLDLTLRRVYLLNSWGSEWGSAGTAWVTFDDVERLLREQGEACVPTGKKNYFPVCPE